MSGRIASSSRSRHRLRSLGWLAAVLLGGSLPGGAAWAAHDSAGRHAVLTQDDRETAPAAAAVRRHGPLAALDGAPRAEADVAKAVQRYLAAHRDAIGGLPISELAIRGMFSTQAVESQPGMVYVQFMQVHEGLEVAETHVNCSATLLKDRTVLSSIEADVYPSLALPPAASRNAVELAREAASVVGVPPDRAVSQHEERRIRFIDGRWRRVREHRFPDDTRHAVVDEATGESWAQDDRVYDGTGTVKSRAVRFAPLATGSNLDTLSLPAVKVSASTGATTYTNATGVFTLPITTSTGVTTLLDGLWARVNTVNGTNLTANATISPSGSGTLLLNPTGADELATAQANGYYHTNFIHDWIRPRLSGTLPGLDTQLTVRVNNIGSCIAYYQAKTSYFFKAGLGTDPNGQAATCINTAFDTVIYHEYGHFVDELAGGYGDMGLSEGWGDVLATFASNQPKIGEGFYGTASSFRRTADNTYQYAPGSTEETHVRGQAWAGFAWHLRQKLIALLGASQGVALAEQLVIPVFLANPADIPSAVFQVALRDDPDGNLANGTPHMDALVEAAAQHRIPLEIVPRLRISKSNAGGWTTSHLTFVKGQRIYLRILGAHSTTPIYFHWSDATGTSWTGPLTLMNPATFAAYQTDWTDTAIVGPFPDAKGIPWTWKIGTDYKIDIRVHGLWSNQLTYTVKAPSPMLYLSKSPAGPWGTTGSFSKAAKDKFYLFVTGATPNTQVLFHWSNSTGSTWYPAQTLINPTTGRPYETNGSGQVVVGPFPNGTTGVGDWPVGTGYKMEVTVDGSVSSRLGYTITL